MYSNEEGDKTMIEHNTTPHTQTLCNLQQVSILEFLSSHYKARDGKDLFMFIYTPIDSVIELLVKTTTRG